MIRVAAGLGDDVDHPTVVVAVFGIEVVGENAELLNGVQVRNYRRSAVHVLLHIDGVYHESVGRFALAIDGNVSGIRVARRIDGARHARHDHRRWSQGRHRTDARLNREQASVAAAVQRNRLDLRVRHYFSQMSGDRINLSLDVGFGSAHCYRLRLLLDFQRGIQRHGSVGIDGNIGFLLRLEPVHLNR